LTISSPAGSGSLFGGPARWGLLALTGGLIIVCAVLVSALSAQQEQSLVQAALALQAQAAHAIRSSIEATGYSAGNVDAQLHDAAQLVTERAGGSPLGIAVVSSDGLIMASSVNFPLSGTNSLSSYKVLKAPDWRELQFPAALADSIGCTGELLLPTGARPGILFAADYSPASAWQVIVLQRRDGINRQLSIARMYLLISFLSLALLLTLLIVAFYLSLAAGLSSAIRSAVALEEATIRFQENLGEFRRPLHNIQGLADMLSITEDPDERNGYLKEIKGEVGMIISRLESSEL